LAKKLNEFSSGPIVQVLQIENRVKSWGVYVLCSILLVEEVIPLTYT